jgi:formimidoylglutamate deiminase
MSTPPKQSHYTKVYQFKSALMKSGWKSPCYIAVDDHGIIEYISDELPEKHNEIEVVNGLAIPGFLNCHSHAFQYAMAGMAEKHAPGTHDDFWSWREAMYQCALSLDADQIQTVATALYIDLLKKGYTHVGEFHYLHHDKNGKSYANAAEISVALLAAASIAGIRITLIPVYYNKGGFGKNALPRQRRFIFQNPDQYLRLLEEATTVARKITIANMGFGVHSLRASSTADLLEVLSMGPKDIPFHIHAAEQVKEVDESKESLGAPPVQWLLDNVGLSDRFNLIHCTHLDDVELKALAASGANAVLCPGTEGNLGDGIFRLNDYMRADGNWCIGTDSHISLNPLEDLRWLDYSQRLTTHKRNTFNDGGQTMIKKSFFCGSKALGFGRKDFFETGTPLDTIVYDCNSRLLSEASEAFSLPRILYTADSSCLLGTIVNGKWIVRNSFHHEEERVSVMFRKTLRSITIG